MSSTTLNVKIFQNNAAYLNPSYGTNAFNLTASRIAHMFTKLPTQAGLPGDSSTHATNVLTIDVGVCTEAISLIGIINSVADEETPSDPSKVGLEDSIRNWWDYGDDVNDLPIIQFNDDQAYRGHIKTCSFTQDGGQEAWWDFELVFLVRAKVS